MVGTAPWTSCATSEHVGSTASSTTDVGHMVYGVETVDIDENLQIFTRSPEVTGYASGVKGALSGMH